MKRFLIILLISLTLFSLSACSKTNEYEVKNANGTLQGYLRETVEGLNEYCKKLEFLDANKTVMYTMEAEDNLYFHWGIFDSFGETTPIKLTPSDDLIGVVYINVRDSDKKSISEKEYYTFPCSWKIMEEYELEKHASGSIYYTSATLYNEDGSVKWSYTPKYANYLVFGVTGSLDKALIMVRELDQNEIEVAETLFDRETLAFESSVRYEYTDASTLVPTNTYHYNEDGSLRCKEVYVFNDEGNIIDILFYDANGNPLEMMP